MRNYNSIKEKSKYRHVSNIKDGPISLSSTELRLDDNVTFCWEWISIVYFCFVWMSLLVAEKPVS